MSKTQWEPIETAPKDGTLIIVGREGLSGVWVARYVEQYQSGYVPDNPWFGMLLNTNHISPPYHSSIPTHWMPMPEPPKT